MAPASANFRRAASGAMKKVEQFPVELDTAMQVIKWTAESLEAIHDEEKVAALREATRDLAGLHENLRLHVAALVEIQNGRLIPTEGQSFTEVLHARTMDMAAQDPRAPEDYEAFKAFNKAVWHVHHRGETMPGEEEEDIVMTSKDLVANATCPLSGKAVTDLDDPVCGIECRHIYEGLNARTYFSGAGKACAVAGCNKHVTARNLVADARLLRDLQELRRNAGRGTQHEEEYTALDDED